MHETFRDKLEWRQSFSHFHELKNHQGEYFKFRLPTNSKKFWFARSGEAQGAAILINNPWR